LLTQKNLYIKIIIKIKYMIVTKYENIVLFVFFFHSKNSGKLVKKGFGKLLKYVLYKFPKLKN
jgi:hypothetical protein